MNVLMVVCLCLYGLLVIFDHRIARIVIQVPPLLAECRGFVVRHAAWYHMGIVANTVLVILSLIAAIRLGVFSRALLSPVYIALGLVGGHLVFGVCLFVLQAALRDVMQIVWRVGDIGRYAVDSPALLLRFLYVSVGEEIVYRVGAQHAILQLTHSASVAILITAVCFSLVHRHFLQNPLRQSCEFLGFSILLGLLYYATHSLVLVILIHAVRNIEISYCDYMNSLPADSTDEVDKPHDESMMVDIDAEFLLGRRLLVTVLTPPIDSLYFMEYVPESPVQRGGEEGMGGE